MRVIRGRADARWIPSRFRFAASRLIAYGVWRQMGAREQQGLVLVIDPDQDAIETYGVSIAVFVVLTCYAGALLARVLQPFAAALLAIPTAALAVHISIDITGLVSRALRVATPRRLNGALMMAALMVASLYFAASPEWPRVVARAFLTLAALNAVAAVATWLLRPRFAEIEQRYEGLR